MRIFITLALLVLTCNSGFSNNEDWGKTGHRATAEIAEGHLTRKAERAIENLLDGRSLAFVSTYADDIKSDPDFRQFGPWHYVNIAPEADEYDEAKANPKGDLVQAIRKCKEVLTDKNASREDKVFYLKMLVHFMGDLHQPFHVGRGSDRGGNDIQVRWFGDGSNLHRLWDSDMIDSYDMSYTELAENTKELSKTRLDSIRKGELLDWVYESRGLAKELYRSVEVGEKLGYEYMYERMPMVLQQLQKGGIRLAKVLNEIFG